MKAKYIFKTEAEYLAWLKKADEAYYQEKALVTDAEYDFVRDEFAERFPLNPYLKSVGVSPSSKNSLTNVRHDIPMFSQSKVNTSEELKSWAEKVAKDLSESAQFLVSEKIDGLSLSLKYENGQLVQAVTRGDGQYGEDVTRAVLRAKQVPLLIKHQGSLSVRGEGVVYTSDFNQHLSEKMENARNAAPGILRRLSAEGAEHISFLAYDIVGEEVKVNSEAEKFQLLSDLNFITPKYKLCKTLAEVEEFYQEYEQGRREEADYEMDGLVVMVNNLRQQSMLGVVSSRPFYSRAFKFSAKTAITTVLSVDWQVGRTGTITPVAQVSPVKLAGVTIANATLNNPGEIKRLEIKLHQKVVITRAGDVIPKILRALDAQEGTEIIIPSTCPVCATKTEQEVRNEGKSAETTTLVCPNKQCPEQVFKTLLFWMQTLEIKSFGEQLVRQLIDKGLVKDVSDFYALTVEDLASLDRMGKTLAEKVLKNLHAKKLLTIPKFIKALGIDQVGEKMGEIVQEVYPTLDQILKLKASDLVLLHGIGEISAEQMVQGLAERKELIRKLRKYVSVLDFSQKQGGKLAGVSFCFTGGRDKSLEAKIVNEGGKIAGTVSKALNFLVAKNPDEESEKILKAKKLNVPIISFADAEGKV